MVTNEVLNTILSRKGVKQYKSNPVPRELLEAIVAAGIAAPNAFNRQAWHFSVITNKTLLEESTLCHSPWEFRTSPCTRRPPGY